jgi:pyridinium-3,5-bisthiocarboxylic acid mononucleotide nickel chelatase
LSTYCDVTHVQVTAQANTAVLQEHNDWAVQQLYMLEANLDDITGETLAFVTAALLTAGALDVWTSPITMKKGRPAHTLHVLCAAADQCKLLQLVFTESTTLGVRTYAVQRCALQRQQGTVSFMLFTIRLEVFIHSCA